MWFCWPSAGSSTQDGCLENQPVLLGQRGGWKVGLGAGLPKAVSPSLHSLFASLWWCFLIPEASIVIQTLLGSTGNIDRSCCPCVVTQSSLGGGGHTAKSYLHKNTQLSQSVLGPACSSFPHFSKLQNSDIATRLPCSLGEGHS